MYAETKQQIAENWRYCLSPFETLRRRTREVYVGDVGLGGKHPIRLQSMTIADTLDTTNVVAEIVDLAEAGSEIVRVTAPHRRAAENLVVIKRELAKRHCNVPIVADIHFTPQAALIAARYVEKVRINPGNYADRKHFKKWEYSDSEYEQELERLAQAFTPLVQRCKQEGVAMRIGTNHGSLSDRIMNRYGDTPLGMVESSLEFVRICESLDYRDLVLSMKASDVKVMIEAYRLLAARMQLEDMDYPFHLGVTEAGSGLAARVKSCIGIGSLLEDGIGDTIRVSLTEDSIHELPMTQAIVQPFQRTYAPHEVESHGAVPPAQSAPGDSELPGWDPFAYRRRQTQVVGRDACALSPAQAPRIELIWTAPVEDLARQVRQRIDEFAGLVKNEIADLLLVACSTPEQCEIVSQIVDTDASAARFVGLEVPWRLWAKHRNRAWPRLSCRLTSREVDQLKLEENVASPLQWTLQQAAEETPRECVQAMRCLLQRLQDEPRARAAVAFEARRGDISQTQWWRQVLAHCGLETNRTPIVLRGRRHLEHTPPGDRYASWQDLALARGLGGLLVDGVGDAVQLHDRAHVAPAVDLAAEVLQATRRRSSQADFIACPSCGRTQFDLQSTSAKIQARFKHLKGLKIAIMGCIVNGPGEMADADFGYVGSGPGRIDLYVGHERVERGVPQGEAVDRLVELVRSRGLWREPGPGTSRREANSM